MPSEAVGAPPKRDPAEEPPLRCAPCEISSAKRQRTVPDTMKAVVWRGDRDPSKMRIEVLKTPSPKADEVLVKVKACGVCHTDLHCVLGEVPFPVPAVFGHEICGEVVTTGELPDGEAALAPGTKVVCPFIMPCGSCSYCLKGEEDTCETFFALNRLKGHLYDDTTRLETAEGAEKVAMYSFAGLAEYAVVPKRAVFALPEQLLELYEESCILGCAFFTAFGAIRNAAGIATRRCAGGCCADCGPTAALAGAPGTSACVIGCGGVGGGLLQLLKHLGVSPLIAVDVTDKALEQAKALGADVLIKSSAECDAVAKIAEATGGKKVDYCFEVIGLKQTFEQAVHAVRDGGRAVYIGISDVATRAEVPITHIVRRRISLVGSYGARASADMPALLQIAADGGVDLRGAITRRFSLEQAGEAYALLQQRKIAGRAIISFP